MACRVETADTCRACGVISASMRRPDVAPTLLWRRLCGVCPSNRYMNVANYYDNSCKSTSVNLTGLFRVDGRAMFHHNRSIAVR